MNSNIPGIRTAPVVSYDHTVAAGLGPVYTDKYLRQLEAADKSSKKKPSDTMIWIGIGLVVVFVLAKK